jgi:ribonucleoside-triphosphate reductase
MTASFGITALNELQELYNGKSIAEDGGVCTGSAEIYQ